MYRMIKSMTIYVFTLLILCFSCKEEEIRLPKPRMYPKVEYPKKEYVKFNTSYCDLKFEYPTYATVEQDKNFFDETPADSCWFNVQFPQFNGTLHCSYYPISSRKAFDELINESYELVEKHNIKSNFRKEEVVTNQYGVSGIYFQIGGEVATNMQFILSDTTDNFFRASLYFNSKVSPDSIRPIFQFVQKDVEHLISTFNWK